MPLIRRPPIGTYGAGIASVFFLLLFAAMAIAAEGLQFAKPEKLIIATVRDNVVCSRGRYNQAFASTHDAKRI